MWCYSYFWVKFVFIFLKHWDTYDNYNNIPGELKQRCFGYSGGDSCRGQPHNCFGRMDTNRRKNRQNSH